MVHAFILDRLYSNHLEAVQLCGFEKIVSGFPPAGGTSVASISSLLYFFPITSSAHFYNKIR
jgi:hypothetical protein